MIRAHGLSHHYGGRPAIEDVDLHVGDGELVGFLGPNGAGKSTTMRCLLGLLRPASGDVHVERPLGYLPEEFSPYEGLTVRGYLRFLADMKRVERHGADTAMEIADLTGLSSRPIARLSRGQRQRVGLAQALLGEPRSLVLDEPTQGLDPKQIVDARAAIRAATTGGCAVLLSTHLLAEAASVCDRVVVIVNGRVVAEEQTSDVADLEQRFLRLVGEAELS